MSLKDDLFNFVEQAQERADSSFDQYPENLCVLPKDAIYPARVVQLQEFCGLIEAIVNESGFSVGDVLSRAIKPELSTVHQQFPFAISAIDLIIKEYAS